MKVNDLEGALCHAFADLEGICGSEASFQANVAFHLRNNGYTVEREFPEKLLSDSPSKNRIDLVIFGEAGTRKPAMIIEMKGGAYGNRQALTDCIDMNGNCKDFAKLEKFSRNADLECCFIAIDLPALGRKFQSKAMIENVFRQGAEHNVHPVVFAMGDDAYRMPGRKGGDFRWVRLPEAADDLADVRKTGSEGDHRWLLDGTSSGHAHLGELVRCSVGHEANVVSCIYDSLRFSGLGAKQVSLETYFSFAAFGGKRMQNRPDICTYRDDFDGQFNLYRLGNTSNSNDSHKLASITSMIEVKSRLPGENTSNKKFVSDIEKDIEKLAVWRSAVSAEGFGEDVDYICFVADTGQKQLAEAELQGLAKSAKTANLSLVTVTADQSAVW